MSISTDPRLLQLSPDDNVAVAARPIAAGETVSIAGRVAMIDRPIPTGHKLAVRSIAPGEPVLKYGAAIGSATGPIAPGDYVHTHNVRSDYLPTFTRASQQ